MSNKIRITLLVLFTIIILMVFELPITNKQLTGVYVNNNFNNEHFVVNIPYTKDTLILNKNGTFSSRYYGDGTYTTKFCLFSNYITITHNVNYTIPKSVLEHTDSDYKGGAKSIQHKATIELRIKNNLFQSIQIILVEDLNYYYSKI